jgi:hypothetical protein
MFLTVRDAWCCACCTCTAQRCFSNIITSRQDSDVPYITDRCSPTLRAYVPRRMISVLQKYRTFGSNCLDIRSFSLCTRLLLQCGAASRSQLRNASSWSQSSNIKESLSHFSCFTGYVQSMQYGAVCAQIYHELYDMVGTELKGPGLHVTSS